MGGLMDGWMSRWIGGCVDGWPIGWIDGWQVRIFDAAAVVGRTATWINDDCLTNARPEPKLGLPTGAAIEDRTRCRVHP